MPKINILILFLCSFLSVSNSFAQGIDSLPSMPALSEWKKNEFHFYNKQSIFQLFSTIDDYNLVSLDGELENGGLMQSQAAEKMRSIRFETEGAKTLNKFRFSGHFHYLRLLADSVGNTMLFKPQAEILQPYYFYAAKKGNWDYNRYDLLGIVSYNKLFSALSPVISVNYSNSTSSRSNDPRPSNTEFNLKGDISLAWQINKDHTAAAGLRLGYTHDNSSIGYKNDAYQQSSLYPDYNVYLMMGYGFYRKWFTNQSMSRQVNSTGFQGSYHGKFSLGTLSLSAARDVHIASYNKNGGGSADGEIYYGDDDTEDWKIQARWSYERPERRYSLTANFHSLYVADFNPLLNGNNYIGTYETLEFSPAIAFFKAGRLSTEWSLHGFVGNLYRADGNAAHYVNNQWAEMALGAAFYLYNGKDQPYLKLQGRLGYRFAVSGEIDIPAAQETMFTRKVVYPDFSYRNTNVYSLGSQITWMGNIAHTNAFIGAGINYQNAAGGKEIRAIDYISGSRRQLSIKLGIIL